MDFIDKQFRNPEVHTDGNTYLRCEFSGCQIVYSGGRPPAIVECTLNDCHWRFDGTAGNTLDFLKKMADPQSGMQDLVANAIPELFRLAVQTK